MNQLFKYFIVAILLCSCVQSNTSKQTAIEQQNEKHKTDSVYYLRQAIDFLQQVKKDELANAGFILNDKPFTFQQTDCLREILADTVHYLNREKTQVMLGLKKSVIKKWPNQLLPGIKIISNDTVSAIFSEQDKGWKYFYSHVGKTFNNYSAPFFFRNYTYCLFYSDNCCGNLCAQGQLVLYKKENNQWKMVTQYCNWVS